MGVRMSGIGELNRALSRLRAEMRSPSGTTRNAMLKRAAEVDVKQNVQTFDQQRDPRTGQPWPTLEEENKAYAAWKRRNWPGRKMLVWTGSAMRNPATRNSDAARVARWRGQTLQLGVSGELPVKHQQGETYSKVKMVFLREKRRHFPGGRRFVYRNGKRTKQPRKGRNWFTLWMRRLEPRPFIGKNPEQAAELRGVIAAELIRGFEQALGGGASARQRRASRLGRTAAAGRLRRA